VVEACNQAGNHRIAHGNLWRPGGHAGSGVLRRQNVDLTLLPSFRRPIRNGMLFAFVIRWLRSLMLPSFLRLHDSRFAFGRAAHAAWCSLHHGYRSNDSLGQSFFVLKLAPKENTPTRKLHEYE
jgi:hypothetical protein